MSRQFETQAFDEKTHGPKVWLVRKLNGFKKEIKNKKNVFITLFKKKEVYTDLQFLLISQRFKNLQ